MGVMSKSDENGTYANAPLSLSISSCSEDLDEEDAVEKGCTLANNARTLIRFVILRIKRKGSREESIAIVLTENIRMGEMKNNRG